MTITILHVDDDKKDLAKFEGQFSKIIIGKEKISYDKVYTNDILKKPNLFDGKTPDVILVDFKFEKGEPKEAILPFDGPSLITHLRNLFPDIPIFLFTKPEWVNDVNFAKLNKIMDTTDEYILKKNYLREDDIKNGIIFPIVNGYRLLKSCRDKSVQGLFKAINAPEINYDDLSSIFPKESLNKDGNWLVFPTAKWIRKVLMKYPGLLYNEIEAATFLGISLTEYKTKKVQDFFESAKYKGPFSEEKSLWWKSELMALSDKQMTESEIMVPFKQGFSQMWKRKFKKIPEPAICYDSGESPADCVCYVLEKPVMIKYSLKYNADERPRIMDDARVSFKAIQTTSKVNPRFLDSDSIETYNKLVKGKYVYKKP